MSLDIVHWVWLMNSSTLESKPFLSRDFRRSQAKRTAEAFRIQIADEISLHTMQKGSDGFYYTDFWFLWSEL